MRFPTAAVAAGSLLVGYVVARETARPLGAVVLVAGAAYCAREWHRRAGTPTMAALLGVYAAAFVAAHPLAKAVGAWPAVLGVSAATGAAAYVLADRRTTVRSRG